MENNNRGYKRSTLHSNTLEEKSLNGGIHHTICESCSTPVRFEIDREAEPLMKHNHSSSSRSM